jgi:hypothetical protein
MDGRSSAWMGGEMVGGGVRLGAEAGKVDTDENDEEWVGG